jgi:uncharacterized protein (DUF433 family)
MARQIALGITVDPKVRFGKPVIEGTRVPVELVIGQLAGGMTMEEVAQEYDLTLDDLRAALKYAAGVLAAQPKLATLRHHRPLGPRPAELRFKRGVI